MEEYLGGLIFIGAVLGLFIICFFISNAIDDAKEKEARLERIAERNRKKSKSEIEMEKSMTKCKISGNSYSPRFVLCDNGKIYFVYGNSSSILEKDIKDLLDVRFNMQTREKNVMKIISIVPAYNKYIFVEKISLIFTFTSGTHEVFYIPEYKNIENLDIQEKIKEMESSKIVIENEMKIFKNEYDKSKNTIAEKENKDIEIKKTKVNEVKSIEELVPTDEEITKLEDKVYEWGRFLINEKNELYFIQNKEKIKINIKKISNIRIVLLHDRNIIYDNDYIPKDIDEIREEVHILRLVIKMNSNCKQYKDYEMVAQKPESDKSILDKIFEDVQIFRMKIQQIINNENM
ncbi:hypothetical protein IC213_18570 [Clostridioides sp. ES-S-0049-02]|uniref:hypothetical protein n=1 Tax=unclassified Clostridioides TaxID=2635829 RepID=UPI001D0CC6BF|nr:hypothetical protein [Clostridioides sp. ES-S-0049-02]MCC0764824.1 hypothetical protein [Clostridioides sp. ES-S-0006-03]